MPAQATVDGEALRRLREAARMDQRALAKASGVSQAQIARLESGARKASRLSTLSLLAGALNVPITDLLRTSKGTERPFSIIPVPIIGTVPGGPPMLEEQRDTGEVVWVTPDVLDGVQNPRALTVQGDSMSPNIEDGEIVIFDPNSPWAVGDVVVALVGNETTVKRLEMADGQLRLMPANHDHKAIEPGVQDVRFLGKVIWIQPKGRKP